MTARRCITIAILALIAGACTEISPAFVEDDGLLPPPESPTDTSAFVPEAVGMT